MEDKYLLQLENASFSYDKHEIFSDVSWNVAPNELWCLMGHNGCGKSTMLDCILGVNRLKSGRIILDGRDLKTYKPHESARILSYVPQVHERSFPYKVKQIVLMGRTAYLKGVGTPSDEDREIVGRVMKDVGVDRLADRPYTHISGGEMQMVLLARALVQQTPMIIMDEPTAHLDFYNELLFLETVSRLLQEHGRSVIMATHSPNQALYFEAQGLNVKVALMNKGNLVMTGRPGEVLTSENLRMVYKIEASVLQDKNNGSLRQIMPLHTLDR